MTQKLHFFVLCLFFSIVATKVSADAARCARDIGTLSRQLAEHQDETRGAAELDSIFSRLVLIEDGNGHVGRLIALGRAFRFYSLFGTSTARLQEIRKAAMKEEDRLLKASRTWARDDQESFIETLTEFNQIFYRVLSQEAAEAFYYQLKETELQIVLQGGKKLLFDQLVHQYEQVFAPAFPIKPGEMQAPIQSRRNIDILLYELESPDADIAMKARLFLSLTLSHLTDRAKGRDHINRSVVIDFVWDQAKEETYRINENIPNFGDPFRNAQPMAKQKPFTYVSFSEQQVEQVRLFAETIEQIQLKPKERTKIEAGIKEFMEMFVPSQYFLILPGTVTAQGLSLYQLAQMGPYKNLKTWVDEATKNYPFGGRIKNGTK